MAHLTQPLASPSPVTATPPTPRYSIAARLGVALLSLLLTAGAMELLLRGYVSVTGLGKSGEDKDGAIQPLPGDPRGYALRPGLPPPFSTNAYGFRGEAIEVAKPPGVRRIVMLGDSITYGNSVEWDQTFSHVLQQSLNEPAAGPSYEVLNLGVSGYNTGQELATLRELGLRFSPDLIVLNVCLNDSDPVRKVTPLGLKNDVAIHGFGDINFRTILQSSYLISMTKYALFTQLEKSYPGFVGKLNSPELVIDPRMREKGWSTMKEEMQALSELAREQQIPLAIVIYPYSSQVGLPPERMKPQQDLLAFAAASGIPALEPSAVYLHQPQDMFADQFIHLSPYGHRVMARAIQDFLAARGLLPAGAP